MKKYLQIIEFNGDMVEDSNGNVILHIKENDGSILCCPSSNISYSSAYSIGNKLIIGQKVTEYEIRKLSDKELEEYYQEVIRLYSEHISIIKHLEAIEYFESDIKWHGKSYVAKEYG